MGNHRGQALFHKDSVAAVEDRETHMGRVHAVPRDRLRMLQGHRLVKDTVLVKATVRVHLIRDMVSNPLSRVPCSEMLVRPLRT